MLYANIREKESEIIRISATDRSPHRPRTTRRGRSSASPKRRKRTKSKRPDILLALRHELKVNTNDEVLNKVEILKT